MVTNQPVIRVITVISTKNSTRLNANQCPRDGYKNFPHPLKIEDEIAYFHLNIGIKIKAILIGCIKIWHLGSVRKYFAMCNWLTDLSVSHFTVWLILALIEFKTLIQQMLLALFYSVSKSMNVLSISSLKKHWIAEVVVVLSMYTDIPS